MLFMTYQKAKEIQFTLEENLRAAKEAFLDFPKNKYGITDYHIRIGHDYRLATRNYNKAYKALDKFNATFEIEFKDEIKAEKKKSK